jgi:hypothetical protein
MDGKIKRRKARIIVGGHWQEKNVNYDKTFAPTPTFALLQTALTVAAKLGWSVASFDVKTAFLHSPINEEVWVVLPPGHIVLPGKVWKLKKALYRTKQAGSCWWLHLKTTLEQLGFTANPQDQTLPENLLHTASIFAWVGCNPGKLGSTQPMQSWLSLTQCNIDPS